MKRYDNGEPITKTRQEEESWYPDSADYILVITLKADAIELARI